MDGFNYVCRVAGLWGNIVPDKCYHRVCSNLCISCVMFDIWLCRLTIVLSLSGLDNVVRKLVYDLYAVSHKKLHPFF